MALDIQLYNTLTKKKDPFKPLKKGEVKMYHCGPTVYNYAHIGNLRSYVFADTLRRMFESAGYKVKQVINITDIGHLSSDADEGDDKMIKGLKREGLPMTLDGLKRLADKYESAFKEDLKALNIETKGTRFERASAHLKDEIALIKKLDAKGLIYKTKDGLYFNTSKIDDYGKLG
ncbi:MAG TPA: class I tRNA ligase family protein, partial [Candidatus Paceibacterota bacterium]|nr:class I tRNA ligase family protein [Candidatus Paceibacterota bacterium]